MLINKDALPTTKQESWKYTNLAAIYAKNDITEILEDSKQAKDYLEGFKFDVNENVVIILDGVLAIDYNNLLVQISDCEFKQDSRKMSQLAILNSKHFAINTAKDTKTDLSLIFINTDNATSKLTNVAMKINVDMFSSVNLDVDFVNLSENTSMNLFLDIDMAESSELNFVHNSDNPNNTKMLVTANYLVSLDKNAEFNALNILHKDALLRNDYMVNLNGEGSKFNARGLYLITGRSIANVCFDVNHNASNTYSNITYNGVVNGNAKAWFNAKAIVNKGLKQIQAFQNNKNIQLSKTSELNTKPELEIYSDDVVCTHGATIGTLDQDALFYMQSRGITLKESQRLLLEGFTKSVLLSHQENFKSEIVDDIIDVLEEILSNVTEN
jgi:Fe-S cluster assembly protein SufD